MRTPTFALITTGGTTARPSELSEEEAAGDVVIERPGAPDVASSTGST
jgi:hypothetical protein